MAFTPLAALNRGLLKQTVGKAVIALSLLFLIPGTLCLSGFADNRQQIQALQARTRSISQRAAQMRSKKMEKMRAAQAMNRNIVQNQQQLEVEQQSLQMHQERLSQTRGRLSYLDTRLGSTMNDAQRFAHDASRRLRSMYEGERLSLLQMILESNDLSTLLDRIYYKERLVGQDKRLLLELQGKIEELNLLKGAVAQQKMVIGQTIATIRVKNIQIQRSIEVDTDLRNKYRHDAAFYDKAEAELQNESQSITAQIRNLSMRKSFQVVKNSTGVFMWPIRGSINSPFGYRYHPIWHRRILHSGLDIGGPNHGAVHAADGGQIIWAGWKGGYGKAIMINHGNRGGRNLVTLYGHLSGINVSAGQSVSKGQTIGAEGSTGYSTGPHLHFEVRVNGTPVDPRGFL